MNILQKKRIGYAALLILMFAFFIGILTCGISENKNMGTKLQNSDVREWSNGWTFQGTHAVRLPYKTSWFKGKTVEFTNVLPEELAEGTVLSYTSNYAKQMVYVEDRLIYSYADTVSDSRGKITGTIRVMAKLSAEDAGKVVRIVTTPYYDGEFTMQPVLLGPEGAVTFTILKDSIWLILILPLLVFVAFLTLYLGFYHQTGEGTYAKSVMFYFALFILEMGLWLFASSDLPQFFTNAHTAVSLVSFMSLGAVPIAFNGFVKGLFEKYRKTFEYLQLFSYGEFLLQTILYCLGVTDFVSTLWLTHVALILTILATLIVCVKDFKHNSTGRIVLVLLLVFILFCVGALITFYLHPGVHEDEPWVACGVLIFSVGLMFVLEAKELSGAKEALKSTLYRKMAYSDALTELGNRMALEQDMDDIMDNLPEGKRVVFVMCDLNRLKQTNDTYGHEAGDIMIRDAAMCIKRAVPVEAHCYRLGGDEFGILLSGSEITAWYLIDKVEESMAEYNKLHEIQLSMAMGSATAEFHKDQDSFFKELYKKADDQMYEIKRQQHLARSQMAAKK